MMNVKARKPLHECATIIACTVCSASFVRPTGQRERVCRPCRAKRQQAARNARRVAVNARMAASRELGHALMQHLHQAWR